MPDREHHHKRAAKRRAKLPPSVELRIPKRTIDVEAWLGNYAERAVEREVHALADKSPTPEQVPEPRGGRPPATMPIVADRAD